MDYQAILEQIYQTVKAGENQGRVATYIPELARVNPDRFGVCLTTIGQQSYAVGDSQERFSIQSIAKVLALCMAYKNIGNTLWKRVGVEPSGTAFNSLVQLESDAGIPRNPLINAGAIVICDALLSYSPNAKRLFLDFVRMVAGNPQLEYSQHIAESEKSVGYRNTALVNFIKSFGNIHHPTEEVLDFYFALCSIEMSCEELSRCFLFLANQGKLPGTETEILNPSQTKRINAIMQTCGFYDEAGEFAYKVGLPGKSGVGGGIVAVRPGRYCVAVWSPRLNPKGNSYRGVALLEALTTTTQDSIF
ncbi:glutaminase [Cytophagales bacterium LB-30]|uniref:Glutaminase n=1 Tax=Shiella aurantiaca TaxID=3058365 RepID=A0ABT8F530_9BACT|nr:glutaminase [Shiella aurantiaca]MDN4165500.1 glutaminase [Shiella aurantiaca]